MHRVVKTHFSTIRLALVALPIVMTTMAGTAWASVRVGGWALVANGQIAQNFEYSGTCPVDLQFRWGIVSTTAEVARYTFTRSDGATFTGAPFTINLQANRSGPIERDWHLGGNAPEFADFHGWMELKLEWPNPAVQRINFTLHCGGLKEVRGTAKVRVGGSAFLANGRLDRSYQYTGRCPVDLTFDWNIIATSPTTATYTFTRSDGAVDTNGPFRLNLMQANRSQSVQQHWRLGANLPQFANYSGWVGLNIESPNRAINRTNFTLHCQ